MVLPNRRSKSINQLVINIRAFCESFEGADLFVGEALVVQSNLFLLDLLLLVSHLSVHLILLSIVLLFILEPLGIGLGEANYINISLINRSNSSHCGIQPSWASPVNTDNFDSISGFDLINHVLVSAKADSQRSLSLRDGVRCLLHLNVLFVREHTSIMDKLE